MDSEQLLAAVTAINGVAAEFPKLRLTYEGAILILMTLEHQYADNWSVANIRAAITRLQAEGSLEAQQ
jgi:hypothetical protein